MGTHVIGDHDIEIRMLLPRLIHQFRDVSGNMGTRLHKKRDDHDSLDLLPDTILYGVLGGRGSILQKSMRHYLMAAALLDLGRYAFDGYIRASASAPMSQDYDRSLHASYLPF